MLKMFLDIIVVDRRVDIIKIFIVNIILMIYVGFLVIGLYFLLCENLMMIRYVVCIVRGGRDVVVMLI